MIISNKRMDLKRFLSSLCFVTILIVSIACNASERQLWQDEWKHVVDFGPVTGDFPTWCGNTALVVKVWDWKTETGGIVYIDAVNKTTRWITRNELEKNPSCNSDGQIIFMYKMKHDSKLEEGHASGGVWAYDLKTGKGKEVANITTDFIKSPASPADRIFAVVFREKKDLQFKKINLPEWRILTFPNGDQRVSSGSQWAIDGNYFLLRLVGKEKTEDLEFYDANGVLIRTISTDSFQLAYKGSSAIEAKKDGVYWFASNGHLRRLSVKTGQIEQFTFEAMIKKNTLFTFDISPAQEIVYTRHDRDNELWIASLNENKPKTIGVTGIFPKFSRKGEFLAYLYKDKQGNRILSVMRRVIKE